MYTWKILQIRIWTNSEAYSDVTRVFPYADNVCILWHASDPVGSIVQCKRSHMHDRLLFLLILTVAVIHILIWILSLFSMLTLYKDFETLVQSPQMGIIAMKYTWRLVRAIHYHYLLQSPLSDLDRYNRQEKHFRGLIILRVFSKGEISRVFQSRLLAASHWW